VTDKKICPICNKRRAERYCPALGEKICAIDCGTEREVTIDCPSDCAYLLAAHRWEQSHQKPLVESDVPFPDISFPADLIHTRQAVLSGLGYTVVTYAADQRALNDSDVFAAVQAMAETRRTLLSGIYYEKPPEIPVSAGLYAALAKLIEEVKKHSADHPEIPPLKDTEIFQLLVLFLRFGRLRSNGRPRTRGFIEFLRSQFPSEAGVSKEEPRIILP
jgi:DNA-binding transcriptional LysR family regulator